MRAPVPVGRAGGGRSSRRAAGRPTIARNDASESPPNASDRLGPRLADLNGERLSPAMSGHAGK